MASPEPPPTPPPALQQELRTFEAHRTELLAASPGKYALVHEDAVAGVFDTEADAIREGYRQFGNVPFLVKRIEAVDTPERFVSNLVVL